MALVPVVAAGLGAALAPRIRPDRPLPQGVIVTMAVLAVFAGDAIAVVQLGALDGGSFLLAWLLGLTLLGLPALALTGTASLVWAWTLRRLARGDRTSR